MSSHISNIVYKPEEPIRLHEFGRNVQQMVDRLKQEPDRDRRTLLAHEVVRVMATVVPTSRDILDFKKRLWELLFKMAGPDLDVELPFPIRREGEDAEPVRRLAYYQHHSKFKQYGKNIELFIQQAIAMPEGPERTAFILKVGTLMKQFLANADTGNPSDAVVFKHLYDLSGGQINLRPEEVSLKTGVFGHRVAFALPPVSKKQGMGGPSKKKKRRPGMGGTPSGRKLKSSRY
jgi:hypothetical protein